jgi:hypothetical protein
MKFGWFRRFGRKSSDAIKKLEIIQPPNVDDSQKSFANWATAHIRRIDKDIFELREKEYAKIQELTAIIDKSIVRGGDTKEKKPKEKTTPDYLVSLPKDIVSSVREIGFSIDSVKKFIEYAKKVDPTGEDIPSLLRSAKMFFRLSSLKTVAGVTAACLIGAAATVATVSYVTKYNSYKETQNRLEGRVDLLEKDLSGQRGQFFDISNYVALAVGEVRSNNEYAINSFRDAMAGVVGKKSKEIEMLKAENAWLVRDLCSLEDAFSDQNEQTDSLASYASNLSSNYQSSILAERKRIERIVGEMSAQVFKAEQKHNLLIEKLNNIYEQKGGIEGRLEILERQKGIYLPTENLFETNLPLTLKSYKEE